MISLVTIKELAPFIQVSLAVKQEFPYFIKIIVAINESGNFTGLSLDAIKELPCITEV
jgi:hypothetical protein